MTETPTYNVGDVVNGHRWTGTEWVPADPPTTTADAVSTPKKPWFKKWWGIGLIGFGALLVFGAALGGGSDTAADTADEVSASTEQTPGNQEQPADEPKDEVAEAPAEELTVSQEQAVRQAENYLSFSAFSKKGLVEQLEFEGYSAADAKFAVNYIEVDWNEQAALKAESYLEMSAFSRSGLIEQLEFEGFTSAQAEYGATSVGL